MPNSSATLWTVTHQALCPSDFPGKNTGVGRRFLLQEIFPTQGLNPQLLHWQADSLPLSHQGSSLQALLAYKLTFNQIFDCVLTSINILKSVLLLNSDYSKCRKKRRHKQESRKEKDIFKKQQLLEVHPPGANVLSVTADYPSPNTPKSNEQ